MNSIVCLSLFCLFSLGLSISLFIYLSIYLSVDIYLSTSTDRDKTFMPNSAVPLGACVCVCVLLPTWSVLYEVCKKVPSQSEAPCMGAFLSLLRYDDHAVADAKTMRV